MSSEEFDFNESFEVIRNNMILLSTEWQFYKSFYSNETNVYILNNSAPFLFSRLQLILVDAIIFKIAKLLDKKETFGKNNLSFDYLFANIPLEEIYKRETKYYATGYRDGNFLASKFTLKKMFTLVILLK